MAHAFQIDTLAFSKKLKAAGADERLAEAIVEGITGADISELATKADIREVKTEIADVKAELKADIAEVKGDLKWMRVIGSVGFALVCYPILKDILHFAAQ